MALFDLTGSDLRKFREAEMISADQMARLLGFAGNTSHDQVLRLERGERPMMPAQCLLLAAYMDGWRPEIWPNRDAETDFADQPDVGGEAVVIRTKPKLW